MNNGDWVYLTTDIWEYEQDGLIPGHYLGYKGDRVQIKKITEHGYYVAHANVKDNSFRVSANEIKE